MVNALQHKGHSAKSVKDCSIDVIKGIITALRCLFDWNFMKPFIINSTFRLPPNAWAEVEGTILHNDYNNSGNPDRLNEGATFRKKKMKIVNHHYEVISHIFTWLK